MGSYDIQPADGQIAQGDFYCGPCLRWVPLAARLHHNRTLHPEPARYTAKDPRFELTCGPCRFGDHFRCEMQMLIGEGVHVTAGPYRCGCTHAASVGPVS